MSVSRAVAEAPPRRRATGAPRARRVLRRGPSGRRRPDATVALALVPLALLAVLGWQLRWMNEDGFIYLRIVENLVAGHGPVFNVGERVEAYTSPAWTALLALLRAPLGTVSFEYLAVVVGLVLSVAGLAGATFGALVLGRAGGARRLLLPLGALVVACLPPFWDFATSGLETGLVFAWTGLSFLLLVLRAVRDMPAAPRFTPPALAVAAAIGLGPLVRPDVALVAAALMTGLLLVERPARKRRLAALAVAAAALPVAYQVFRMGYFGALVPNTAFAKEASLPFWTRGAAYAWDTLAPYALWAPLAVLAAVLAARVRADLRSGRRRLAVAAAAPAAGALLHALYVIRLGGDYMHARMLLPTLFALLAPVAVTALPRARLAAAATLLIVPWALVTAVALRADSMLDRSDFPAQVIDHRRDQPTGPLHPHPVTLADHDSYANPQTYMGAQLAALAGGRREMVWFWPETTIRRDGRLIPAHHPAPNPVVRPAADAPGEVLGRTGSLGRIGYAAGERVHIEDPHGLANAVGARTRIERRGKAGHEKILPVAWFLARYADPRTVRDDVAFTPPVADVDAARRALGCGPLRELVAASTEPLSPRRFVANMSLAVREHGFRMPADPHAAARELCG